MSLINLLTCYNSFMIILRTRFAKDIVCEYVRPASRSNRVIILCSGMPSYPGRREALMEFLSSKGYWVFVPRYRGTWESEGEFMRKSPHVDVLDVIKELSTGFTDLWSGKLIKIPRPQINLIGVRRTLGSARS